MAADPGALAVRRRRVWQAARAAGHDALVVVGRAVPGEYGMYEYLTGACPPHRAGYAVLMSDGTPAVIVPTLAEAAALDERAAAPVTVAGAGAAADAVAAVLAAAPDRPRNVGIAGLGQVVPVIVLDRLRALLPTTELVDATGVVSRVKALPDQEIVVGLQVVAMMLERGLRRFREVAGVGHSCRDLAAEVERELRRAGARDGFAYVGPGEPTAAGSPAAPLREGDLVSLVIEAAGPGGEWVEVGVLHAVGELPPPTRALAAGVVGALLAGVDALRAGRRAGDVARTIERAGADTGLLPGVAHGHGVGIDADEPVIEVGDHRALRAGAGIALHPSLQHDGAPAPCAINTYIVGLDGAWPLLARPHALHTIDTGPTTRRSPMAASTQSTAGEER